MANVATANPFIHGISLFKSVTKKNKNIPDTFSFQIPQVLVNEETFWRAKKQKRKAPPKRRPQRDSEQGQSVCADLGEKAPSTASLTEGWKRPPYALLATTEDKITQLL